jgi:PAS domain-containing protein
MGDHIKMALVVAPSFFDHSIPVAYTGAAILVQGDAIMVDHTTLLAILDSLPDPILVADTDHVTRYMNQAAIDFYEGGADLIGRSLLDCHNDQSQREMIEILAALHAGEQERLITLTDEKRVYMRAVRDPEGKVLGYYERYEWLKKPA